MNLEKSVKWELVDGDLKPYHDGQEVVFYPQEGGQMAFMRSPIYESLIEGNRGGGKSLSLLMDFAQHVGVGFGADWKGVIFRQTYPQLQDIVTLSKKWFPRIWPQAQFNEAKMLWKFPGREELLFRHIATPDGYWNYHGWQVPWIGFEELTTWADPNCYLAMFSINRSTNTKIPRKIRSTTNPYGPGHGWVKARFHLPIRPGVFAGPMIEAKDEKSGQSVKRIAFRCLLQNNKVLMNADPGYIARVMAAARNPSELAAWVDGSWDIVAGGMFDDVYNAKINIIPNIPFGMIPQSWRINRAYDHGQSKPFSLGWWAESNGEAIRLENRLIGPIKGDLIRIAEWYGWCGQPNEGLRITSREIARTILEKERQFGIFGRVKSGVADSAIFDDYEPGRSVAGDMRQMGVHFFPIDKGPGSRAQGWQQMRQAFKYSSPGEGGTREFPGLFVCARCDQFIRTVPVCPRDTTRLDDLDTSSEDHIADETRYRLRMKSLLTRHGDC